MSLTPEVKSFITQRAGTTKTEKAQLDELIAACESLPVSVTQGDVQAAMAEVLGTDSLKGAKPIARVREEILNRAKTNRLGFPDLSPLDFLCACVAGRFSTDQRGPIRELRKALIERKYQVSDLFALARKKGLPDPAEWTVEVIEQLHALVIAEEPDKSSQASAVIVSQGKVTVEEIPLVKADPAPPAEVPAALAEVRDTKCVVCQQLVASATSPSPNTCSVCLELQHGGNANARIEEAAEAENQVGASLPEHLAAQEPTPLSEATPREDWALPIWLPPMDEWLGTVWRALGRGSENVRVRVIAVVGFGINAKITYKTIDDPSGMEHTYQVDAFVRDFSLVQYVTLKKEEEPCPTASAAEPAPTLLTFPTSASLEELRAREAELEEMIRAHQRELDQVRAAIADEEQLGEKRRQREALLAQLATLNAELGEIA